MKCHEPLLTCDFKRTRTVYRSGVCKTRISQDKDVKMEVIVFQAKPILDGIGTGRVAATIGIVRSATVDVMDVVGNAGAVGHAPVVVAVVAVGGNVNATSGAVIAVVARVVSCGDGGSAASSVLIGQGYPLCGDHCELLLGSHVLLWDDSKLAGPAARTRQRVALASSQLRVNYIFDVLAQAMRDQILATPTATNGNWAHGLAHNALEL
ncbi:Hypothetical predicted protein [Octopus vulgaris]|uniref:Uncharacterized protein n=1 Tax=Octopus vulgaris TaxID=6645 RepID=A0AA36ARF8_OCTVU|nr:Hypothetical predicted protein [Octopus vulgaris]